MRWSPSYRSIIVLGAEANVARVILDKNGAINHREMQQTKFAEK
jgi:hypothetical protein